MTSVIVVEPSHLIRLGVGHLLRDALPGINCTGLDYDQLFAKSAAKIPCDLALLAVPDATDRILEVVEAAVINHAPKFIVLLTEEPVLRCDLSSLPASLSGYVSKYAEASVLIGSIQLVLAGGKCFPMPGAAYRPDSADGAGAPAGSHRPRRRWYDQLAAGRPPPQPPANSLPDRGPEPQLPQAFLMAFRGDRRRGGSHLAEIRPTIPAAVVQRESALLGLTARQYDVLVLLARGYSAKHISRELEIAASTVKTHVDAIYKRLSVHSRHAAIVRAFSKGATMGLTPDQSDEDTLPRQMCC
ncbi:MAG TPA: response regulator transcription factor [Castellaniella sp.]|uniref:helix-turn-helix transcriptional regulator n=1 Tax=Castellaniella sp. TaxID=1955812 RepID=UPI002EFF80E0